MNKIEYNYPLMPVDKWIENPYFVGKRTIFPFWKQKFIEFFNSDFITFILYGSYGIGKSFFSSLVLVRLVYEIESIKNFPSLFGLDSSTKLKIAFISMTLTKSESTGIARLIRMFDSIPFFQQVVKRDENVSSIIRFNQVEIIQASNVTHITGEDCFGVLFDESNFIRAKKGEEYEQAKTLFLESQIRGATRFTVNGKQIGVFGLMSSADCETSFTEMYIKKSIENKSAMVITASVYDVKYWAYSKEKFQVFAGTEDIDPFIVDSVTEDVKIFINKNYGLTLEQFLLLNENLIVNVPVDLRKFYEEDVRYALKTLSGIPQKSSKKLLKNPNLLKKAFEEHNIKNPVLKQIITLSLFDDDNAMDFIDENILMQNYEEGQSVYIHIDLAKNKDEGGFSACYKNNQGKFVVFLYFPFRKKENKEEIDFEKIIDLIVWLKELGIYIKQISFDQFQSVMLMQQLQKKFNKDFVVSQSVDRNDNAYMTYLFLLKKNLITQYQNDYFFRQFQLLNYESFIGKIDHPEGEDKGLSDAVVGSVSLCFQNEGLEREEIVVNSLNENKKNDFYSDLLDLASKDNFYDFLDNEETNIDDYKNLIQKENIKIGELEKIMMELENKV